MPSGRGKPLSLWGEGRPGCLAWPSFVSEACVDFETLANRVGHNGQGSYDGAQSLAKPVVVRKWDPTRRRCLAFGLGRDLAPCTFTLDSFSIIHPGD